MITRLRNTYTSFDPQFWVLFAGSLINAVGFSFVFPFLTLYLTERHGLSLTTVGALITLNAGAGVVAQAIGGSLSDQLGRKLMMVVSMLGSSLVIASLGFTETLLVIAVLIVLNGFINPLFRPASQAMIADLVEPARRAEAYGLMRVANNLGVVIGPSIGGFIATRSYLILFLTAATAGLVYFFILLFFTRETKPETPVSETGVDILASTGYRQVLQDRTLLIFCAATAVAVLVYSQLWTVFPVYIKAQYGIPENRYGLLMALNAAMVVTMQFAITRVTRRFPPAEMMTLGALLYTVGVASVGLATIYWQFALNIVVVTLGEMILIPTAAAYVAELAPAHLRGRYMGAQGLANGVGFGIGPLLGGALADQLGASRAWSAFLVLGLLGTVGFLYLRGAPSPTHAEPERVY